MVLLSIMGYPKISVVMPCYNCSDFIVEAIESILNQTFDDFEFLIIDDGSTDDGKEILKDYARKDNRIKLFFNDRNEGLIYCLNKGLDIAQGEFIARMDADDISHTNRFEKQIFFLNSNPKIGICGTYLRLFGDRKNDVWKSSVEDDIIKCQLLFRSSMPHATVMWRRSLFENHFLKYDKRYIHAEDYALWVKASQCVQFSNIPEVLYYYRQHPKNVARLSRKRQINTVSLIQKEQLNSLGIIANPQYASLHYAISIGAYPDSIKTVEQVKDWLARLVRANDEKKIYPEPAFSNLLADMWMAYKKFKIK